MAYSDTSYVLHKKGEKCIFDYAHTHTMILTAVVAAKMDVQSGAQAGREFVDRLRYEIENLKIIDPSLTDIEKSILDTSLVYFERNVQAYVSDLAAGGSLDKSLGFDGEDI